MKWSTSFCVNCLYDELSIAFDVVFGLLMKCRRSFFIVAIALICGFVTVKWPVKTQDHMQRRLIDKASF